MLSAGTDESIRCSIKGKLKLLNNLKKDKLYRVDLAVVGDIVDFDLNNDGSGVIYNIRERRNYISRKAPRIKGAGYRGERLEQIISSNIDNLFIVCSSEQPKFNNKLIDRILVAGESSHLNIIIVINKIDLADIDYIDAWSMLYTELGYKVFKCSALDGHGLHEIHKEIRGKINLFWGQSGVGKSSLLNALFPDFNLKVGDISTFSQKGRHTTVTAILLKAEEGTFIIDTPGIREIDPYGIRKENLGHYFREFNPHINNCRFNSCTHFHEPGCAVMEAVESGDISAERYDSYLNILNTIEEGMVY